MSDWPAMSQLFVAACRHDLAIATASNPRDVGASLTLGVNYDDAGSGHLPRFSVLALSGWLSRTATRHVRAIMS